MFQRPEQAGKVRVMRVYAYAVDCPKGSEFDYRVFTELRNAEDYADSLWTDDNERPDVVPLVAQMPTAPTMNIKCDHCGKFMSIHDAYEYIPYGRPEDIEPPDPVAVCGECVTRQGGAEKMKEWCWVGPSKVEELHGPVKW